MEMFKKNFIKVIIVFNLFLFISISISSTAQSYKISFAASGASTNINSIEVKNLTKNLTLTLSGGDTLQLGSVGINDLNNASGLLNIYPNPMCGKSVINFEAKNSGNVNINVVDLSGKQIINYSDKLIKGNQKFELSGLMTGVYFINITGDNYFYNGKLISQSNNRNNPEIKNITTESSLNFPNLLKSSNSIVNMLFSSGDRILFKGISGNYSTVITDVPTANKTVIFNFVACTDGDNNNYSVVKIGTQTWMAENLKATKYSNGNIIENVTDSILWSGLSSAAYCDYNNSSAIANVYGRLYNWYAVNDSRNLCPTGWHVPTDAEWTVLTTYLGGENIAGGKLKSTGTEFWKSPNFGASNETGFTALPAGYRFGSGSFSNIYNYTYWWTNTEANSTDAYYRFVYYQIANVYRNSLFKSNAYSVRCLKN